MIDGAPRLLFVPVSGAFGMGEYARSLAIARQAAARWPGAAIQFILSREAPYAALTPFPATLLASSPTFHSAAVVALIERWRPDLVIFDNAGRTAQLRAAKRAGAGVVYISARRRQRRKAFRMRWMRLIDEHWIAYPEFVAGSLGFFERLKLRLMRRPRVRYLDVILAAGAAVGAARESMLTRIGVTADDYVLVVPGGGTGHPGARDAVAQFRDAALSLAAAGVDSVLVAAGDAPPEAAALPGTPHLRVLGSLPQPDLAELMRAARVVVSNGGSTLLQAIGCARPCLAAPIAGDQEERIRRCVAAGAALAVPLESAAIAAAAAALWADEAQREQLAGRAIALGLTDGLEVAMRGIHALLAKPR